MKNFTVLALLSIFLHAECVKVVVLHPAEHIAAEYGRSVNWVYASGKKIKVWQRPSDEGRGRKIGEMLIGSRAKILEETTNDYKVQSPLDKSIGWVSKVQVMTTWYQDDITNERCIK